MDYSFTIKKAEERDASAIREIMKDAFGKYSKDAQIETGLEALDESLEDIRGDIKNKHVFIARIDDIPAGSVRIAADGDIAWLTRFGVKEGMRNMGVGNALVSLAEKYMIQSGVKRVFLHTASKYADLVRYYYGRGFYIVSTDEKRGYIRALMQKDLA